jgi:uncharacterized protein YdeI (YjbR/CyaY-like superfamily)
MEITQTLFVTERQEWREWLVKHYKTEKDIWLIYYREQAGGQRISYNDAVEEALCFGWIDSTVKNLDDERYAQRFSVRNPKTGYSQTNKERLCRLTAEGKVIPEVLATLGEILNEKFEIPPDILEALQANGEAWKNFQNFSGAYQRIRIGFIDGARKRPEEFQKRLKYFLKMTEQNKKFGYDIESFF